MRNVALVGEFGSGKTTIAKQLIDNYGYTQVSFARNLKRLAAEVYGGGSTVAKDVMYGVVRLDGTPERISGRQVLQELGQSVKALDRDFWVNWLISEIGQMEHGPGPYVIDDCRFPYEADALREQDFLIVRIFTPDQVRFERYELTYGRLPTTAELNHPSETEVKNIRYDMAVSGVDDPVNIGLAISHMAMLELAH